MITIATLQTRIEAAIAALDGADYQNAIRLADGALLMLAAIPDSQFDNQDQIKFDRAGTNAALKSVISRATAAAAAASTSGGREILVRYERG